MPPFSHQETWNRYNFSHSSQTWSGFGISHLLHDRCICWVNVQCWICCLFDFDDAKHLSFVKDQWLPPLLMTTWPMCSTLLLEKQSLKQVGNMWVWKPWRDQPRSIERASWGNMRLLRLLAGSKLQRACFVDLFLLSSWTLGFLYLVGQCLYHGFVSFVGSSALPCPPLCLIQSWYRHYSAFELRTLLLLSSEMAALPVGLDFLFMLFNS